MKLVSSILTPHRHVAKRQRYIFAPHQSERERFRRLRQIAKGQLWGPKGYVSYFARLSAQELAEHEREHGRAA